MQGDTPRILHLYGELESGISELANYSVSHALHGRV